jgi:hypothetical protein
MKFSMEIDPERWEKPQESPATIFVVGENRV